MTPNRKITRSHLSHAAAAATLLLAVVASPFAAASPASDAQAALRDDIAVCNSGASPEGRSTCLKEAHAAYAQKLHGGLSNGDSRYDKNARQRCDALAGSDRDACRERMRGEGTTSGSAAAGGVLRELVTTTPAPAIPPAPPRPPAPAPSPSGPR